MPIALSPPRPANADADAGRLERASSLARTLPHNVEAEKALLGAIFVNNRAYEKVSDFLKPEHFALGQHERVFDACRRLIERGQMADPVTLRRFFEAEESLAEIGGPAYLNELALSAATVINAGEYGRLVYDLHLKRELIQLGEDVVNRAYGGEVDETAVQQIESAEQALYDLAVTGEYEGGFRTFRESLARAYEMARVAHERQRPLVGVTTGFLDVDELLGGLHPSDLVVLAGRPAMGKTALATNVAYQAAVAWRDSGGKEGAVVGFFSLEMSAEQLALRIISEQTNIASDRIRKGRLGREEFDRLQPFTVSIQQVPLFIDDTPALTIGALRTRARRLKRQHDLGLVVIDYLQLITPSATNRNDSRVQEVAEITRGLKTLAKELNVPVLALSQLSRAVEQRDDKRPQLADLRESGAIEQDSDVVMFIYREEYYLASREPKDKEGKAFERWQRDMEAARNLAEIIVAKQRHGPTGTVRLFFDGTFTRFGNWDRQHAEGEQSLEDTFGP
jgi:replicative DNA helicase